MTNLYFFHLHACYSIFQNFFCAGIQFFVVLNSYDKFTFVDEDGFITVDYIYLYYGLSRERDDWKRFAKHVYEKLDCEMDMSIRNKYLYLRKNIDRARAKFMKNKDYDNT